MSAQALEPLAIETDPGGGQAFPYNEQLYLDVRQFIEDHLELVEDAEYDVLAAKVFESWLPLKLRELAYVFFVGPPRSGKTRGLQVMSALCFNPKFGAYMSGPALYRVIDGASVGCTLFLDEIQQYLNVDAATFLAILNAGQRRGEKAIIMVRGKEGWEAQEFDVFCPKFLASTKDTVKSLETRCIIISMIKNARRVPFRIDGGRAAAIRERLNLWAKAAYPRQIPYLEKTFIERGFKDYRNIEAFLTLAAFAPPMHREAILKYAKEIDDQIAEEDGLNFYAELFEAVDYAYKTAAKGGKVSIQAIAEAYNDGRDEVDKLTNREIGSRLNIIGLRRKCRVTGGRTGRYVSEKVMKRLRRRYRTGQTLIDSQKGEHGEDSEGEVSVTTTTFIKEDLPPLPGSQFFTPPLSSLRSPSSPKEAS